MTGTRPVTGLAVRLAALIGAATGVVALAVHAVAADAVRQRLAFPFAGLPANPQTALSIFLANARLLGALVALILLLATQPIRPDTRPRSALSLFVVSASDALIGLTVAFNVFLVGAALGAYGPAMLAAILPHGPLELAAYALALALYLRARQGPVPRLQLSRTSALGVAVLAAAAVLETYVAL